MPVKRLMRETRTLILVPIIEVNGVIQCIGGTAASSTLVPFLTPTTALLNKWQGVVNNAGADGQIGGNISPSVLDTAQVGSAPSTTGSKLTIISVGNEVEAKFANANIVLEWLRNQVHDTGNMNMVQGLLRSPDIRYAVFDRTQGGKKWDTAFAVGDVVSGFIFSTDHAIDNLPDQDWVTSTQTGVSDGNILPEYTLAA